MSRRLFKGVSLRFQILAAFVLIVVGGAVISTLIGSRIITKAMLDQAHKRVLHGLETGRGVYAHRLNDVGTMVEQAALTERLKDTADSGEQDRLCDLMSTLEAESNLDFLSFVDTGCSFAIHGAGSPAVSRPGDCARFPEPVKAAMEGESVSSTEVVGREFLLGENPALAEKARINIRPVPMATPNPRKQIDSGMVLFGAAPVHSGGKIIGVVYGGVLLNHNYQIVDQVKRVVFGGEKFEGRCVGTVTIFMQDVRVSTNVVGSAGDRAVGTGVSEEVAKVVIDRGDRWHERAFVVNEWQISAYEPIRNQANAIVGVLCVGILEEPFLAVRTRMMLTFLVVAGAGVLIVLLLTYLLTRAMILPLEEMVSATKRIAGGDLDHGVAVHSGGEIGHLAVNFNKMLASLKSMKAEQEQWAHTLERKVEERTAELMAMQTQMAQSEKLASMGRLAAGVAHEINNPLGGIMAFSMTALEDCRPEDPMRENLDTIVKQTLRCREIVKGLLDFSRQSETEVARVEINPVVENTLALLDKQAIFHNIKTIRIFQEKVPPVFIDPHQMQQVLINILLNAADAMEESGTLTVETAKAGEREEVVIRISDTGKGIAEKDLPLVFEPFYTTKKVGQGTGLGLAIAHGVVNRAGGRIEVSSRPGETTFSIFLPTIN
jgi:two-component system NtrC family sensor kinase